MPRGRWRHSWRGGKHERSGASRGGRVPLRLAVPSASSAAAARQHSGRFSSFFAEPGWCCGQRACSCGGKGGFGNEKAGRGVTRRAGGRAGGRAHLAGVEVVRPQVGGVGRLVGRNRAKVRRERCGRRKVGDVDVRPGREQRGVVGPPRPAREQPRVEHDGDDAGDERTPKLLGNVPLAVGILERQVEVAARHKSVEAAALLALNLRLLLRGQLAAAAPANVEKLAAHLPLQRPDVLRAPDEILAVRNRSGQQPPFHLAPPANAMHGPPHPSGQLAAVVVDGGRRRQASVVAPAQIEAGHVGGVQIGRPHLRRLHRIVHQQFAFVRRAQRLDVRTRLGVGRVHDAHMGADERRDA